MSFNDKLSYTEHSVVSPTSDFTIGFEDYALTTKDRINVTVDDIDAKEAGYTVTRKNNLVVTLTPPVPNGVVRLQRETNIDTPFHRFTAGAKFVATNVDQNFTQILHSQQEVRNLFGFTQDYIQRTLDNFDLRIQGVESVVLDLRTDYDALNRRLESEVDARKEGDADLKAYVDALVNGVVGEDFLPIRDKFVFTEGGRTQHDTNRDVVHLKEFGAIANDPTFDNSAIIKFALESGVFINFGGVDCNYYVSNPAIINLSADLFFISGGASITVNATTDLKTVLTINTNGNDVGSLGRLTFNCQLKAFSGIYVSNAVQDTTDILLNSIEVFNCRRSSTAYTGGDGIYITGNVDSVVLNQPKVDGVYLAKDAGVAGTQGVSGITIVRSLVDTSFIPKHIVINEPNLQNVMTEDLDYYPDQDGIRVFTRHSQPVVLPSATTVVINNPYFKNCLGRAVKSQAEIVYVNNPTVYRDIGFTRGYGNPEFDFQVGGGKVVNGHCIYKNTRPLALVYMYGSSDATKNEGLQVGGVDGLNVSIEYDTPTEQTSELLRVVFRKGNDNSDIVISNVNVRAKNFSATNFLQISRDVDVPKNVNITLENCSAPISATGSVLIAQDQFIDQNLIVNLHGFNNSLRNNANVIGCRLTNFQKVNTQNCTGLLSATVGSGDLPATFINSVPEYGVMPVVGDRRGGGNVRFGKYRLTSGNNQINIGGYNNGIYKASVVLISIARTRNHTAIIATDNSGCTGMFVGSEISIGSNAPSAEPKAIDIYVTDGTTLNIDNTIGAIFATIQMLG